MPSFTLSHSLLCITLFLLIYYSSAQPGLETCNIIYVCSSSHISIFLENLLPLLLTYNGVPLTCPYPILFFHLRILNCFLLSQALSAPC